MTAIKRDFPKPLRCVMSGPLPEGRFFQVFLSGEPTVKALGAIERNIALTMAFLTDDEAKENQENANGDGI